MNVSEVVVVPRLEQEVNLEDVSAEVAVRWLGYDSPTTQQKEVVTVFVKGNDVFVFLPTGGGKSLCYACLPWVFDALRSGGEVGSEHPSICGGRKSVALPDERSGISWIIYIIHGYLCYFQFSRMELRVCRYRTFHILCMPS